jgi:hypothetical protein
MELGGTVGLDASSLYWFLNCALGDSGAAVREELFAAGFDPALFLGAVCHEDTVEWQRDLVRAADDVDVGPFAMAAEALRYLGFPIEASVVRGLQLLYSIDEHGRPLRQPLVWNSLLREILPSSPSVNRLFQRVAREAACRGEVLGLQLESLVSRALSVAQSPPNVDGVGELEVANYIGPAVWACLPADLRFGLLEAERHFAKRARFLGDPRHRVGGLLQEYCQWLEPALRAPFVRANESVFNQLIGGLKELNKLREGECRFEDRHHKLMVGLVLKILKSSAKLEAIGVSIREMFGIKVSDELISIVSLYRPLDNEAHEGKQHEKLVELRRRLPDLVAQMFLAGYFRVEEL